MSLASALKTGDVAELPSRRDEDWRWTDLRGLIRTLPERSAEYLDDLPPSLFGEQDKLAFEIRNGVVPGHLSVTAPLAEVLELRIVGRGAGSHTGNVKIDVGGRHVVLLESYTGEGEYLSEIDLAFSVDQGGSLVRVVICDEPANVVSVSRARVSLARGAAFAQTIISTGARRQRMETVVTHSGGGARASLDGIYLLSGQRHSDITTIVEHTGPGGTTNQLTKGCVRGQARGVFQGRIIVNRGADGTDARMGHHALILSERAEVDAKPELEIYADDVSCSHGNTVGALDEEALFYMAQRGLPDAQARALLTEAFVGEVVDRIEHEGAREIARGWVAERLRADR